MNGLEYARFELERAGLFKEDSDYDGMLGTAAMELIEVFGKQGHSGFSAEQVVRLFEKLARFQPLTPLTGEDDEWTEYPDGQFQNKRCTRVFKDSQTGPAYDIRGRIFRELNGQTFTSNAPEHNSSVPVTFPYWPTSVVVDVESAL